MFERFTDDARAAVIGAQGHARRLHHPHVGTEHLLLALLEPALATATVLEAAGLDRIAVESAIARARSADRVSDADRTALASLGIDLDRVVASVESAFGPGALTRRPRTARPPRLRRRRRHQRCPGPERTRRFSPRAKAALELSLREALRLKQKHIGSEHIALGVLREGQGLACAVLVDLGVDLSALRWSLEAAARQAA